MGYIQMTAFEFFKTKRTLSAGVYEITEHDGEINIVELNSNGLESWYSVSEFEELEDSRLQDLRWANDGWSLEEEFA